MQQQQQGRSAERVTRFVGVAVVFGLFVAACASPFIDQSLLILPVAFDTGPHREQGWKCLAWGWVPPFTVPWLANLFLLLGLVGLSLGWAGVSLTYSVIASLLALTLWGYRQPLLIGYYLWQASMLALVVFAFAAKRLESRSDATTSLPDA